MPSLLRQWLLTLLLGSAFYAAYHGLVHFSDWCYLGVSSYFAAGASWLVVPVQAVLLRPLAARQRRWSAAGRWAWLLTSTLALFGLANLLTWPLHTWLGPGGTWPWGVAALLVAAAGQGPRRATGC